MFKTKNLVSVFSMLTVIIAVLFSSGCKDDAVSIRETTYKMNVKDVLGVSGTATFVETNSTSATINIKLTGAPAGTHPAQLCMNSEVEGGMVVVILNPVDANGESSTVVTKFNYTELIAYDGFIRILKSSSDSDVILAQGDIGGNVITNISKTYPLSTLESYGVSGNVLMEKRMNGNTLLTITLTGVIAGDQYPATINLGSVASVGGGPVVKTLNYVDGDTGKGYTNIRTLNSGIAISYDNWLVYDGYINIYQKNIISGVVISNGNIGSN